MARESVDPPHTEFQGPECSAGSRPLGSAPLSPSGKLVKEEAWGLQVQLPDLGDGDAAPSVRSGAGAGRRL